LAAQQPAASQPPPVVTPPPPTAIQTPPTGIYPPAGPGPKVLGDKTKWALGLGAASLFCCGPITGIIGIIFAKQDMDEIAAGRAPQLDEGWAKAAFYLNIAALILFIGGLCMFWGSRAMFRL
jgi:hypothetical protein